MNLDKPIKTTEGYTSPREMLKDFLAVIIAFTVVFGSLAIILNFLGI